MSIAVTFTTGSKRENSTKQLTMSVTHDCVLKNGCSLLKPTLLLELNRTTFPKYTAFKIEDRYYNVVDVRSVRNNLFEVSGRIDVLATYKTNILNTVAYVIYDSEANSELIDNRLPMITTKSVQASTAACPFVPDGGTYILSLTGSHGTTGVYKVSRSELADLIDDLEHIEDNIFDFSDITPPTKPGQGASIQEWLEFIGDYFQYMIDCAVAPIANFFGSGNIPENIRECKFIPFDVGTTSGDVTIYLGTFKTHQSLGKLNTETVHRTTSVSIPWQASDYRRRSPYTDIYLYLPYIGMVHLSSENLTGQSSISVSYTLAMRDGQLICTVSSGSEILGQYSGNVGASVPVGISNINIPRASQSLISGAVATAKQNLAGVGMAAISLGDSLVPNYSCIGGLDGIAGIATNQNITCYTVFHDTIAAPNTHKETIGAPTMKPKSLSNLTGFVQTLAASVDGAMTSEERSELNSLLDRGIFIE